jgi:hypothetical protein
MQFLAEYAEASIQTITDSIRRLCRFFHIKNTLISKLRNL